MVKGLVFSTLKKATKLLWGKKLGKIPGSLVVYKFLSLLLSPKVINVQGSKMYLDRAYEKASCCTLVVDLYEPLMTDIFKKSLKRGDTVVDVGAYIGYYSLLASRIIGSEGKVYAFEPEPQNWRLLNKNIELNGYNNILPVQTAVSKEYGATRLFISRWGTGHSLKSQDTDKGFIDVETTSLDEFFKDKNHPIDIIKVDVEGAEMDALLGMERIIKQNRNLKMFIEFRPFRTRRAIYSAEEFLRKLWSHNFLTSIIDEEEKCLKQINDINQLTGIREVAHNLFLERKT